MFLLVYICVPRWLPACLPASLPAKVFVFVCVCRPWGPGRNPWKEPLEEMALGGTPGMALSACVLRGKWPWEEPLEEDPGEALEGAHKGGLRGGVKNPIFEEAYFFNKPNF